MRLRNMYLIEIMHIVETGHTKSWDTICEDFLRDNNDLLDLNDIAFKHNGDPYPPRAVKLNRKHILNRKSSPLHEDLVDAFELMKGRYIDEWLPTLRSFKNLMAVVFREASSEEDIRKVIPSYLVDGVQEVGFIPLKTAKGISTERAAELKQLYARAFGIEAYISVSRLI